ncbi:MAG: efflux RND transporter permease subunit [Phycisphaerae bacterium]
MNGFISFFLQNKLVVALLTAAVVLAGLVVAPFDYGLGLPREPVAVDAIPNIGPNQQIVFTEWPGRSPQNVDDQVTYPLTTALLGVPGVETVRSRSMFGFSTIFVIFEDGTDFYFGRSRLLEKLASLSPGTLPDGVQPQLGPDATALGQVFMYTLEGRDEAGNPAGGWDLHELRTIQDFKVKYALAGVPGVSEVASIGGFEREYQIDVDPDALRAHGVTLHDVVDAVRTSNTETGARTIEVNRVEYLVRGLGFLENLEDIARTAVKSDGQTPVRVEDVATVTLGPALRRGVLDKSGVEAVGGIVTVRYGANPMQVIEQVKAKLAEIAPGLPVRTLADGTTSRVTLVPFYDRTTLIDETLGTLDEAIIQQVLVTVLVVVLMVLNLRVSLLLAGMLPLAVLMTFLGMRLLGVDANLVSLAGIAIAVGTIVDVGIVLTENTLRKLEAEPTARALDVCRQAATEVAPAITTAVLTTVVSFLPVFFLGGQEGKLFGPLAWTKTLALVASIVIALVILPAAAHALLGWRRKRPPGRQAPPPVAERRQWWGGWRAVRLAVSLLAAAAVAALLADAWMPLSRSAGYAANLVFVVVTVGGVVGGFWLFQLVYPRLLAWALANKAAAMSVPAVSVLLGLCVWFGAGNVFGFLPAQVRSSSAFVNFAHAVPGLGRELMPALDEGEFLYMPTVSAHASIGEATDVLQKMDAGIASVPEVELVVGKIGRAETALDPAPLNMVETIVRYKPEWGVDEQGEPVRQWRDHIRSPGDIWDEIAAAAEVPGATSAPPLQPIETRLLMLQTGFRSDFGIKVFGPDLASIDRFTLEMEKLLKQVPGINPATVIAERLEGKPYLEIEVDRDAIARYGLSMQAVQEVIAVGIGGEALTTTVEGRERYPVRVRYARERRDEVEKLLQVLVPTPGGAQVPLEQLATLNYRRGPQMIQSEDTFLVGYLTFGKEAGVGSVRVVEQARAVVDEALASGRLSVPAGVSWRFDGEYRRQQQTQQTLLLIVPGALGLVFLLLYLQFRSMGSSFLVFCGVFVAWSGGFLLLWFWQQPWFFDVVVAGRNLRDVFGMGPVSLSVAVWVGFLALFGIATDDGVVMATRLRQSFEANPTDTVAGIRAATVEAGKLRIRACLMTTATTVLALLPVLTATGRGSDLMKPMALPIVGGMMLVLVTLFVVPTLWCLGQELRLRATRPAAADNAAGDNAAAAGPPRPGVSA